MKKYQTIAEKIKERIIASQYKPQSLLPNQSELVKEFGVSKITIKNALDRLAHEGLVYKKVRDGHLCFRDCANAWPA